LLHSLPRATKILMVNGDRVLQAREIAGLTQNQLAQLVRVEQPYISMIEKGLRHDPSESVIQAIALATGFSVSFFHQPTGPEFPAGSLLYRRRKMTSSQDLVKIRQVARLVFEIAESMSQSFQTRDLRIPNLTCDAITAAGLTRNALGMSPDTPAKDLIHKLEKNGAIVIPIPFDIPGYDAFSAWTDTDPRKAVVVLGAGRPGDRQKFSIAHEIGHLVLHRSLAGDTSAMDDEADLFASEFLLPFEAMKREMHPPLTLWDFADLKARWGVSMQALVMRAAALGIIEPGQKKYLLQRISAKGWRIDEPVKIAPEQPRLFKKMAETLFGVPVPAAAVAGRAKAPVRLIEEILRACSDAVARTGAPTGKGRREGGSLVSFPGTKNR
jgi:Zn-dependent peptidase ImmA (M78 family)/transcriptional regulator with XRE-family HTH domain